MAKTKKDYSWIAYLKDRIEKNKNFLAIVSGPTGSGKSWSAISIAEMLNDDFCVRRIIFKGKELMKEINSNDYEGKKGIVFIWDEAGIDLSNRNWQSVTNKMLNYLLQTFRHKNFILLFTAPYTDFLDVASIKLFHAEFETVSINKQRKTVRIKPKLLQYNAHKKKWYRKYLIRIRDGMGKTKIKRWDIPMPSKKLIEQYENKKNMFTASLNKDIGEALEQLERNGKEKRELTELQANILKCWEEGILIQRLIAEKLGKPRPSIAINEGYMRRKGYLKPKRLEN